MRKTILMFVFGFVLTATAFAATPAPACAPQLDLAAVEAPAVTPVPPALAPTSPEPLELTTSCEGQCQRDYKQCLIICGDPQTNCLISCEDQLCYCLQGCGQSCGGGSES